MDDQFQSIPAIESTQANFRRQSFPIRQQKQSNRLSFATFSTSYLDCGESSSSFKQLELTSSLSFDLGLVASAMRDKKKQPADHSHRTCRTLLAASVA
jgi:hypothetical protein